jgi:hypothetical protein
MGNGELGMGNGEEKEVTPHPPHPPYSLLPTPYSPISQTTLRLFLSLCLRD